MRSNFSAAFLGLIAIAASVLAANVRPAVAQSTPDAVTIKAADLFRYSRYYAPYAIQSAAAYLSFKSFGEKSPVKIKVDNEGYGDDVKFAVQGVYGADVMPGREAIREWQYQFGNDGGALTCLDDSDDACKNALRKRGWEFGSGPAFQVWAHTRFPHAGSEVCTEISIAFRGTVGWSGGDWFSNADRYGSPYDDYYHQLQRNINGIVSLIKNLECYKRAQRAQREPQIVSTGHSLGGGLAQFVALANKRIRRVIAFDPSPVTGAHLIDKQILKANVQGLTIDRIYQEGEVLSLPRRLVEEYPPLGSPCDPVVRNVRVDAISGNSAADLHMIKPLAVKIVDLTYDGEQRISYKKPASPPGCHDDGALVASAGGQQKLASFVPNYGGYADQFGASYAYMQDSGPAAKPTAARTRGATLISRGHRSRNVDAASSYAATSYNVAAHAEGTMPFLPLPRAE